MNFIIRVSGRNRIKCETKIIEAMETGLDFLYCYQNLSPLYNAWRKYYDKMGLAYNKREKKVYERVRRGKFPPSVSG